MDANAIARALVEEMSDAVQRHIHPRSGDLVPPRLYGRHAVPGAKIGEQVLDLADELIETACESWLPGREPDVALELGRDSKGWTISWTIESDTAENVAEEGR